MGHRCLSIGYSLRFIGQDRVRDTLNSIKFKKISVQKIQFYGHVVDWIRIGFHAAPDPDFYHKADRIRIQVAKPMRIYADLDPDPDISQTLKSQKVDFLHEK
jgi:hypothetical protein